MIYSKFGTRLTLVSKNERAGGKISIQAMAEGATELHEYVITDLKADDGMPEINAAVAKLPAQVFESKSSRRGKTS
jgi:hypothetical protein